jgi:hypothetical protein
MLLCPSHQLDDNEIVGIVEFNFDFVFCRPQFFRLKIFRFSFDLFRKKTHKSQKMTTLTGV